MERKIRQRLRLLAVISVIAVSVSARPKVEERNDNLVRLMKAEYIEQLEMNGQQYRKAIKSTFLHNGTYLISDTALWNVDTRIINCIGHVKVIQDETILTADKLDYFIDDNLAQFKGTLVQLQNKKRNLLRTRNLDYNTKDSMAFFRGGAAMRDENGQLIESLSGTYDSQQKSFTFQDEVNMFTDSVFIRTTVLHYYSEQEMADFPVHIDFWKDRNMLSADIGWYKRGEGTFFFTKRVHGLTAEQEFWGDSLYYYQPLGDMLLLGDGQVQDSLREVAAMADRIHYEDSIRQVTLSRNAAVVMFTENDSRKDTIYIGADRLVYRQIRYCDIPEGTLKDSKTRMNDILTDAVSEFRAKAAQAAKDAAEAAKKEKMGNLAGAPKGGTPGKPGGAPGQSGDAPGKPAGGEMPDQVGHDDKAEVGQNEIPDSTAVIPGPADSSAVIPGLTRNLPDSLGLNRPDSLSIDRPDSLSLNIPDSLGLIGNLPDSTALADSLAVPAAPKDTTYFGFAEGVGNVKVFRRDIQVRCDSLLYSDLDSIARFYLDPVVWNEGNRQYTADSLFVLVGGGGVRKASLQSNAFVITMDAENCYDQIKGAEIMAYFDSTKNTLQRFDAMGGSSAIFYLEENGVLATVNKVETKMLSGNLKDGTLDQVFYFESPKNNAYPLVQLPESERNMKGFQWRPDERPAGPEDVTPLKLRIPQRKSYRSRVQPRFTQAQAYFPGYISGIRRQIAIRDSLARLPKPAVPEPAPEELLTAEVDSIATVRDSLLNDIRATVDSIAATLPQIKQQPDSLKTNAPTDSLSAQGGADELATPTVDPKQKRREERELRRALRIAERDARDAEREKRWAELDSLDAAKEAAKQQKILQRERERKLRKLQIIERRRAKEEAKLQKYIEKYQKEYERKQQKSKSSRKRAPAPLDRREIPAPPGSGKEPARGDALLGNDGPADDDPVLGGGGVPGA